VWLREAGIKKTLTANAPTLVLERKKRKRAKRLNLCGEDDTRAQFYSPNRIKVAQAVQAEKEALDVGNQGSLPQYIRTKLSFLPLKNIKTRRGKYFSKNNYN